MEKLKPEIEDRIFEKKSNFSWINSENWWKWLIAFLIFIVSPIYLTYKPEDFTPLVQILFSTFLFLMAYWIGTTRETEKAIKQANDKWLPQAESVIYRLLTLHNNVERFALMSKNSCTKTKCSLPELEKEELKAVKIKLETDCDSTTERLTDIALQLEDAISDWSRFIAANCDGSECERIFWAIDERRERLNTEIIEIPEIEKIKN